MAIKKEKPEIENYQIDPRLKVGRDYPDDLIRLVKAFITHEMMLTSSSRKKTWSLERQILLAEETFKEYFLHNTTLPIQEKEIIILKDGKEEVVKDSEEIKKVLKKMKDIDAIHLNCIRRINARLKYFSPQLTSNLEHGYKLEPFYLEWKKDNLGEGIVWSWLAATIDSRKGLNPELVHECFYCKKIFFSRQRKKYHPECQSKYFSEKAVKEGIAKRRQKDYRERKKKNVRVREKG